MRMRPWRTKQRPITPALLVIEKFDGISNLGRALGKGPSTVQRWLDTGFIPPRYQAEILTAAQAAGIELDPAIFVPVPAEQADAA